MQSLAKFSALILLFSACASIKPGPVREKSAALQRGWTFAESAPEQWALESGVNPLSFGAPTQTADKIIFGSSRFGIGAIHKKTGKVLWKKALPDGASSAPLASKGKVYIAADDAQLYAFAENSGADLWHVALPAGGIGQPLLAEDRLYVACADDSVTAFDPDTGKTLWTYKRPPLTSISIKGGGMMTFAYGKIWIGMSDGTFLALNPQDGGVSFEKQFRDNIKFSDIDAAPLAWRDGFLLVTYDGKLRHIKRDGGVQWEFASGGAHAPLLSGFDPDLLFFPSSDGAVYAVGASGKEVWQFILPRGVPTNIGILSRDKNPVLAITSSEHYVYLINARSGALLAKSSLGPSSGSYSGMVVDGQNFYLVSNYSRVYQFSVNRE